MQPEISRKKPALVIFLIDQSYSMTEAWGGGREISKADELASIINNQLTNLLIDSVKEGGIRSYFHISVIGYGGEGEGEAASAFIGGLQGKDIATIDEIGKVPARLVEKEVVVPDDSGVENVRSIKMPVWIDPVAEGTTPMYKAFAKAEEIIAGWLPSHQGSHPPIVFNITDGAWTGPDPTDTVRRIQSMGPASGNAFIFNCHISSESGEADIFPESDAGLKTDLAKKLFGLSSTLSPSMVSLASRMRLPVTEQSRGFTFNADKTAIANFLEIGTREIGGTDRSE